MGRPKRKLTRAEKAAKARRQAESMTIFIRGKQKRVRRPPTIDGLSPEEFVRRNADPIWLLQNEEWELLYAYEQEEFMREGAVSLPPGDESDPPINEADLFPDDEAESGQEGPPRAVGGFDWGADDIPF